MNKKSLKKKLPSDQLSSSGRRCLLLYGDIGDEYGGVSDSSFVEELLSAEREGVGVDVRVNSQGGEVYSGIAMFNALRGSSVDVRIYVDGIAASMASVIALCGKPVEMSRYARLMLHSVSGGCYGNKDEIRRVLGEIESLEDTLCEMYGSRMSLPASEIRERYFDGRDHWLTAHEALSLGLIDGIYDAEPVPRGSTPEQIYTIFNNRLAEPQNERDMNIDELKKRPQFKDCATEADVLARLEELESDAARADSLSAENAELRARLSGYESAEESRLSGERSALLDAAERDGRIDAVTRPVYENLLKEHFEDGKTALAALQPKRRVVTDLGGGGTASGAWEKRQAEIRRRLGKK